MAVYDVESDSSDCSNKFWTRPDANDESSEGYIPFLLLKNSKAETMG